MPKKRGKKRKAPSDAKWVVVKKGLTTLGFGENFEEFAFDLQCKQIASQIPRTYKTPSQIQNQAAHLWLWNQEGCVANSDGMGVDEANRRLKKAVVVLTDEEDDKEDSDLEDKEIDAAPPRRSIRKKKKSPSPPSMDDSLLDDEEEESPKPPKRRRLRSKTDSLEDLDEDEERKERNTGKKKKRSGAEEKPVVLDEDTYPAFGSDDEEQKKKESAQPKPAAADKDDPRGGGAFMNELDDILGSQVPTLPENPPASRPSNPSLGMESQEFLPPPSMSLGEIGADATQEDGDSGAKEEATAEVSETDGEDEEEATAEVAETDGEDEDLKIDFEEFKVCVKYLHAVKGRNGELTPRKETLYIKETSVKPDKTSLKRLRKKIVKYSNLRICHNFGMILKTPTGPLTISEESDEPSLLDSIQNLRDTYDMNGIYIKLLHDVLIDCRLYVQDDPDFHRLLCFKEKATVQDVVDCFPECSFTLMWLNGNWLSRNAAQHVRFVPGEVQTLTLADDDTEIPNALHDSVPLEAPLAVS